MNFRDLTAEDIECRVQSVKWNKDTPDRSGVVLLLYKNARVDMNILDETVGAEYWQREHYECKGNLFCRVGIDVNALVGCSTPRWVFKSDCGVESNTEAQKGEASDSFKRACFNWGIGRELYTSPFIWIAADKCDIKDGKNNTKQCYDKFEVEKITIQDKRITSLVIRNVSKKCIAYSWEKNGAPITPKPTPKAEGENKLICTDCGKAIDEDMARRTQKAFGVVLCKDCGLKRSERK